MKHYIFLTILVLSAGVLFLPPAAAQDQAKGAADGAQSYRQVDANLTLPAGTLITVRTTQTLSSDRNLPHDA